MVADLYHSVFRSFKVINSLAILVFFFYFQHIEHILLYTHILFKPGYLCVFLCVRVRSSFFIIFFLKKKKKEITSK